MENTVIHIYLAVGQPICIISRAYKLLKEEEGIQLP